MTEQSIKIREYQKGDEAGIYDLLYRAFGVKRTLEQWRWKFMENPAGESIISVAISEDKIIGHYAVIPFKINFKGEIITAYQEVDLMVDPIFRGKGIFKDLSSFTYERVKAKGAKFTFGYPNLASSPIGFKHFGWEPIFPIPSMNYYLNFAYPFISKKINPSLIDIVRKLTYKIRSLKMKKFSFLDMELLSFPLKEFARKCGSLYKLTNNRKISVLRDEQFLNWRYSAHSGNNYEFYAFFYKGELKGYAILRHLQKLPDIMGLCDLYLAQEDTSYTLGFMISLIKMCFQRKVDVLRCWSHTANFLYPQFLKAGFWARKSRIYQVIRPFCEEDELSYLRNPCNWMISWGDSDTI